MPLPHYVNQTQTLKRVLADPDCRWIWGKHAPIEMNEEKPPITYPDVKEVLRNGKVVLEEYKQDTLWRVRGRDLDHRSIFVVVAVDEAEKCIKIITVFSNLK